MLRLPHISQKQLAHVIYPIMAGVPTAILILYAFDLSAVFKNVLDYIISPVITGIVSGFVLYRLGVKK